jgi:pimeloyl-ACP methyl ester carboxylesterase
MLLSSYERFVSMKKNHIQKVLIITAAVIAGLVLIIMIVPLFISASPQDDLVSLEEIKNPDSRFIEIQFEGTDGITIHYIEKGTENPAEPVFILLHGSLYNLFSWDNVIEQFSPMGRVIAYDQVPFGLSEKLTERDWTGANPYTQKAAVEQLITLLDTLDFKEAYLVGSSYGGTLAVRTAAEYADRVAGLILIDAAVFVDESMPEWLLNSRQMDNIGPLMARSMGTSTGFFEKCYADPAFFSGKRKDETMIMTKVTDWDFALWQYLKAWGEDPFDYQNRISDIDIPVLIISGEEDSIVPPEDSQKLDKMLSDSTLRFIPASGHMPHEETPEKVLDIVLPWLSGQLKQ